MITDVEFRSRFFADPIEVCRENDVVLTPRETSALLQVSVPALHGLTAKLDPKIVRAASDRWRAASSARTRMNCGRTSRSSARARPAARIAS